MEVAGPVYYTLVSSPIGPLMLTSGGQALTGLYMSGPEGDFPVSAGWLREDGAVPFPEAARQLESYFNGTMTEFDLPLDPQGTPFQKRVWQQLIAIPFGTTISYGELATRLGDPKAVRAVGLANGRNPISIIIPCHRVIGSNGKLVGYGGGLPRKAALLDFEFFVRMNGPSPFPEMAGSPGHASWNSAGHPLEPVG